MAESNVYDMASRADIPAGQPGSPWAAPEPVRRYTGPAPMSTGNPAVSPAPALPTVAPTIAKPTIEAVDENQIREQTRQRMQAQVDAINASFTNLIRQEQARGVDREGQTRAVNARSGLMGGDFGAANAEKTTQFNKEQVQALEAQKQAQIISVLANIEDRATAEIQRRKNEALQKYQMDFSEFEQAQESARADLKTLAQSGVSLDQLNPAQKAALFKQSGYDEQFGELIYNANKPKPQQIDYKFEKLADGKGMFYGVDPQTGELKRIDVSIDLPPDWSMTVAPDGTVIGFDKNSGQARLLSEQGQFAKPNDPLDDALKQAQIAKIEADIAAGKGGEILSVTEAEKLGVPYGTSKEQAYGITVQKPLSAEAAKLQANVQSGMRALGTIKKELFTDGDPNKSIDELSNVRSNIIFRSGLGMAREYKSATQEIMDILVRLRTGAAISENEEKFYKSQLPMLYDNEATIKSKLKRFEELFNDIVPERIESQSDLQQLESEIMGGSEGANPKARSSAELGKLSEKYESGGRPGAIGYDNTGGWSYGTYQLAHNNVNRFLEANPQFGKMFQGLQKGTTAFNNKWKEVAGKYEQQFAKAQKDFIAKTHYDPQVQKLQKMGIALGRYSSVLKDVVWSTAVQHGANTDVIAKAFQKVGKNASEADLIKAIYNERWSGGQRFARSTENVKKAVYNRFFGKNGELTLALSRLNNNLT